MSFRGIFNSIIISTIWKRSMQQNNNCYFLFYFRFQRNIPSTTSTSSVEVILTKTQVKKNIPQQKSLLPMFMAVDFPCVSSLIHVVVILSFNL